MTDKEKLEKLKKLADAMYDAAQYLTTDAPRLHKAMEEYHQFIIHEYRKEEPVSEELEEAMKKAFWEAPTFEHPAIAWEDGFRKGAKWQKLEDMGITNNAKSLVRNVLNSSDEPLDTYATEVAFMMLPANLTENYHMKNRSRISDAVRLGAKWQKEQMMKDAVECEVDKDYYIKISDETWIDLDPSMQLKPAFGLKKGDKVKMMVIKEE